MRQWKNADDDKKFLSALFTSKMIADIINNHPNELGTQLRELLFGGQPSNEMVTPDAVGRRLMSHVGNVVEFESPIENTEDQFHSRNIVLEVTKPKGGGGRAAKAFYVRPGRSAVAGREVLRFQGTWGLRGLRQPKAASHLYDF